MCGSDILVIAVWTKKHMKSSAAVEAGEERLLRQRAAKRQRERERRASETIEQREERLSRSDNELAVPPEISDGTTRH